MKAGDIKLTKEQIIVICENIKLGMPKKWAIMNAGVSKSTFYGYLQEAEKIREKKETGKKLYKYEIMVLDLSDSLKKAESEHIKRNLKIIDKAAETTWQAAAWQLERRYPYDFGKFERIEVQGDFNVMEYDIPVSKEDMKHAREQLDLFLKRDDE